MGTVTERAKEELKSILSAAEVSDPEISLRFALTSPWQFGLLMDKEREGDQVVEHENSTVLLVEKELGEQLEGVTIDCQDSPEGSHLVMAKD